MIINKIIGNIIKNFLKLFTNLFIKNRVKLISYEEANIIMSSLEKGDVILTRTSNSYSNYIIPGYWKHAALYIGNGEIVEAVYPEVHKDSIVNLIMHTHNIVVLRFKDKNITDIIPSIVSEAISYVGKEYDQELNTGNDERLYCSEVIYNSVNKASNFNYIESKYRWGYPTYSPDDIFNDRAKFDVIMSIVHEEN